jgi:perosamine synthetase
VIPVSAPLLDGNELKYVRDCIETGWISSVGEYVERFEQMWAEYCGMRFGIAVSSGTAALQISIDALKLGPGDEVIMPSFTIISCALAVVRAGATPVLVDCDPDTYCMDVNQVAAAITPRTGALMPVHMYGHPVDMDPLLDIAERHGLAIIEDAAEAHGSEYLSRRESSPGWRRSGSFGTISAFSFYANKVVTTGEGGMLLTNDEALAKRCRSLRDLGLKSPRFEHDELGYSSRMTNVQAAIGVAQLERIPAILDRKREIGAEYNRLLAGVNGIKLPTTREWARPNFWMYGIVLTDAVTMDADALASALDREGIQTRPFFLGMHQQPSLRKLGLFAGASFPVTERLRKRGLYLPSGAGLTHDEVERVAAAVAGALR